MDAYVSPASARTFARGILALADEIDGGEVAEAPVKPSLPKVGDRIRILVDGAEYANVEIGDEFEVSRVVGATVTVIDHVNGGHWYFRDSTSYELMEPESAPAPAPSSTYADLVREAKGLLTGTPHSAADIITLARDLAERS
jgi:hypothetical protein